MQEVVEIEIGTDSLHRSGGESMSNKNGRGEEHEENEEDGEQPKGED